MELPTHAAQSEYKEKIKKSYPFHPELIDVFRVRWASSHTFQRTRGVLRLLAAIVSDLWKRQNSLTGSNLSSIPVTLISPIWTRSLDNSRASSEMLSMP